MSLQCWRTRLFHDTVHLSICAESAPRLNSSLTYHHPPSLIASVPPLTCHTMQRPPSPPTTNAGSYPPSHPPPAISSPWLEVKSTMRPSPLPLPLSGSHWICEGRSSSEGTQEITRFGMTHPLQNHHSARLGPLGSLAIQPSWALLVL